LKIKTTRFGEIEFPDDEILTFSEGLIGFEDKKKFVLLPTQETSPLFWLQSIEDPDLGFIVAEPWTFVEDYEFELPGETKKKIKIEKEEDVRVLCLVVIPENPEMATMNLKGPIILNLPKRQGQQVVLGEDYSTKHRIFKKKTASA